MFEGVRPQLPQMRTSLIAKATAHSVIVSQNFPQINFAKSYEIFREIDPLKESTNKQLLVECNFSAFRSPSRNRVPNVF